MRGRVSLVSFVALMVVFGVWRLLPQRLQRVVAVARPSSSTSTERSLNFLVQKGAPSPLRAPVLGVEISQP